MDCIFCKIINGSERADIVYEDDKVVAFKDINPKAKVHILIVPKKHVESIKELGEQDRDLISEIIFSAKKIAEDQKIDEGYKLVFNVGRKGGQIVDHVHLHLLGGQGVKDLRL